MLTEAITATLLLLSDLTPAARNLAWIGMALLVVIWLSTAFLQVPLHRQLAAGYDSQSAARLVRSNWLRTIAWTLRGFIAMSLLPAVGLF
jgi:GAF domain-containing protein